jgi:threonine/homoserine/homoserine lactone efflux protein
VVDEMHVVTKGMIIGFVIALPLGPIGILCARRMLMYGRRAGFFSGMGAATADVFYGFIAAFGLTVVSDFVTGSQFWIRFFGGIILCIIGMKTFFTGPQEREESPKTAKRFAGMYTSTFFLTLTNPMTIFSFAAVFAGFGLAGPGHNANFAGKLVLGVFLGSCLWWLVMIGAFTLFKQRIQHDELKWINRLAGILITGCGVFVLISLL